MTFLTTTHLQDILENSDNYPIVIFKYSNSCQSSNELKKEFKKIFNENILKNQVYLVTVQIEKNLSKKIAEYFNIQHESPQVIVVKDKHVLHSQNHKSIKVEDLLQFSL